MDRNADLVKVETSSASSAGLAASPLYAGAGKNRKATASYGKASKGFEVRRSRSPSILRDEGFQSSDVLRYGSTTRPELKTGDLSMAAIAAMPPHRYSPEIFAQAELLKQ